MDNPTAKKRAITIQHYQEPVANSSSTPKLLRSRYSPKFQNPQPNMNSFQLSQSTKLDRYVGNFSTRASGKINCLSPHNESKFTKTQAQTMQIIVKENLKSLSYREKLANIEALVKRSRDLCTQYGYFYITCAMLSYDPFSQTKLSVWIHPDNRVKKCLHPITKNTQYEKQIEFIANLKTIIKQFFPTIYLSDAKTFASLLIHLNQLKSPLLAKNKKSRTEIHNIHDHHKEQRINERVDSFGKHLNFESQATMKKKFKVPRTISEVSEYDEEKQQRKNNLIMRNPQSMKKKNKDHAFFQESHPFFLKHKTQQENIQRNGLQQQNKQTKLDTFAKHIARDPSPTKSENDKTEQSQTKKNDLESQLNNLFGSNDFGGFYDGDGMSEINNKKSMMQRMNDQFENLF